MRGVSWRPNRTATYWPPLFWSFLSCSAVLLNQGPGGPASLGAGSLYHILSPTGLISNWLNFLCTELYNCSTSSFFLWASQIALFQPVHGQGYILIFLDRMHLLFTQVHFLFWQLGRVGGQYVTYVLHICMYMYISHINIWLCNTPKLCCISLLGISYLIAYIVCLYFVVLTYYYVVQHLLFVLLRWFVWWEASGRPASDLWGSTPKISSK